eukprot:TRINITY_DN1874_c0_g1_i1.p1 TRINITY_DN1874_c0_g1~~TRINITY_DN1874_c0_g1_i1.p1  ORF type:complete len:316 (+),score=45.94 TRINITY_DN1874_c0_g1_i1:467-1414(+)
MCRSFPRSFVLAHLESHYASFPLAPVDDTRVKLQEDPSEPGSDYINANYVTGENATARSYIACQGPLPNTFPDFWRMVWETNSPLVIMLSREKEKDIVKVDRYWPSSDEEVRKYGPMIITLKEERVISDVMIVRVFQMCHMRFPGQPRKVEQYQYTGWPDHGVPSTTHDIRTLIHTLAEADLNPPYQKQPGLPLALAQPTILHCSAGIGRTGAFCAIHMTLQKIYAFVEARKTDSGLTTESLLCSINVCAIVRLLRTQRLGMVQQQEQYSFCHYAIQDELVELGLLSSPLCCRLHKYRVANRLPIPPCKHVDNNR